jgi:hypothetical protein
MKLVSVLAGSAGNQVLEWSELDSEIKTAGLKDVSGDACLSKQRSLTVSHRILLPLRICTLCIGYRKGSANSDLRLVNGNMRHNWRTGKSTHNGAALGFENKLASQLTASWMRRHQSPTSLRHHNVSRQLIIPGSHALTLFLCSDHFRYTKDTYNNPENVWTFVSVSPFMKYSKILLIEALGKRWFSAADRPRGSCLQKCNS